MIGKFQKEFIFEKALFQSCHASTLVPLKDGGIYAAWFGGSREGADDVRIWGARRESGRWSAPEQLTWEEGAPHWNPVLLRKPDGNLLLFYKIGKEISSWQTKTMESSDEGRTWKPSRELVPGDFGGRGPVRNKAVILSSGRIAAPASTEQGSWRAFADLSDDGGRTWKRGTEIYAQKRETVRMSIADSPIPLTEQSYRGRGVIQPTIWESSPGCVHMLMRSSEGRIYRSDSNDNAETWCEAFPTELPNNNSGIDLALHSDGKLYLAYNPIEVSFGPRTPLVLACSADNGNTWENILTLEDGEGEYSYPAVLSVADQIWISYTWKRERIAFWKITIEP